MYTACKWKQSKGQGARNFQKSNCLTSAKDHIDNPKSNLFNTTLLEMKLNDAFRHWFTQ